MKKTTQLISLFVGSLVVAPLTGCGVDNDIEVCFDADYDNYCDDDGSYYDADSYVVIDGVKQRVFVKEDSFDKVKSGFGNDSDGSHGG